MPRASGVGAPTLREYGCLRQGGRMKHRRILMKQAQSQLPVRSAQLVHGVPTLPVDGSLDGSGYVHAFAQIPTGRSSARSEGSARRREPQAVESTELFRSPERRMSLLGE